jgi:hypothetical protein
MFDDKAWAGDDFRFLNKFALFLNATDMVAATLK